jgi:predicted acetyltransferase
VLGEPAVGYALYRSRSGRADDAPSRIELDELIADDVAASAALWRFLSSIDLIDRVTAWNLPMDDPLPLIVADPDRVRVTGAPVGNWLRLIDLPVALRAHGGGADVTARVHDAVLPANDGIWHLGSGERAATADVELDTRDLASLYLGGTTPAALHRAGLLTEHTPGAAARLDAAWRSALAPYGPDDY